MLCGHEFMAPMLKLAAIFDHSLIQSDHFATISGGQTTATAQFHPESPVLLSVQA